MLQDRYDPMDLFTQIPGCCLRMEPELAQLDSLLEDDVLYSTVKQDLARRYPHTLTRGRHSTPVEVILRMLVVKRLYGWSYEQVEYFVNDSLTLRQFCRVYFEPVPDDTTLVKWCHLIEPETLARLNDRAVALAREKKLTRGRKLRLDTTVVETNVHPPADSSLLTDGVRVISRLLRRARAVLQAGEMAGSAMATLAKEIFRDRTRSMRRRSKALRPITRRPRKAEEEAEAGGETRTAALQRVYRGLLAVARQSGRQAQRVREALGAAAQAGQREAARLAAALQGWEDRLQQAMEQTRRRVLDGEVVPAQEKVFSLFEEHTRIFQRGKAGKKVEFGRKIVIEEVEGGILSGGAVLEGACADAAVLPASLKTHRQRFGKAPEVLAADRGFYSAPNEALAREAGVKRVAMPYSGPSGKAPPERREQERQRWFRDGYGWRAGIEGRISLLQRRFGLKRCLYHGERGMKRWLGWGILAHNLWQMGRKLAAA